MNPQLAFLLNQCVISLQNNNEYSAELFLKQAVKLAPKNPDVLRLFGIIEAKRNNFDAALVHFQKALKVAPKNALINSNIGNVFLTLKRYEEALSAYEKSIALDPSYAESYNNKGNALQEMERYEEALSAYEKAISLDPSYAQAYSNKGNALHELKRYEEALICFDRALALCSNYHEAYCNKAVTLYELLRYDEALVACETAISLNPNYAEAYYNKGLVLQAIKRYQEALSCYQQAIQHKQNYADAHLAAGILYLRLGDFKSGWQAYEWRWVASNTNSVKYPTSKPEWDGKNTEQRILIWPEQGVGDKILYSSMLKEVSLLSPKITVLTDGRLLEICRRSFPNIDFVDEKNSISEESYDVQIPMGSLMRVLRPNAASFKNASFPYLVDSSKKTMDHRGSFRSSENKRIICGISWFSSNKRVGDHKSIPLRSLCPLLNLNQFEFLNLQYGNIDSDLESLDSEVSKKIQRLPNINLFDDLDDVLSLIQACDLVLTCSNSVAHMAGALNKKTILMLPFESGKLWCWYSEDGKSLCYPSVEIFNQSEQGNWDEVVERVRRYMETLSFE